MGKFLFFYQAHVFCAPHSDCCPVLRTALHTKHCLHYTVPVNIWTDDRGRFPHRGVRPWLLISLGNASLFLVLWGSPRKDGRNLFLATMRPTEPSPRWIALRSGRRAQGTSECSVLRTCSSVVDVAEQAATVSSEKNRSILPWTCAESSRPACLCRISPAGTAYSRPLTPCWPLHRCTRWRP
jgi:hypothetical protein